MFQRALQYNDPKKVHLALLGMYERTEQHRLADELVEKMTKKFKQSCKVFNEFIILLLSVFVIELNNNQALTFCQNF